MRKLAVLLPTVLLLMIPMTAFPQSLGDLAKKEKERREEVKNSKVITDEEAAKYRSEPATDKASSDKPESKAADSEKTDTDSQAKAKSPKADSDEPVDFEGRPESYWRKTMTEARQNVKNLENEGNVIALKLNGLQDQLAKVSDGFSREKVQREMQKAYYEQDMNKENLAKAKAALQDLENDARKSGALPGWIEER